MHIVEMEPILFQIKKKKFGLLCLVPLFEDFGKGMETTKKRRHNGCSNKKESTRIKSFFINSVFQVFAHAVKETNLLQKGYFESLKTKASQGKNCTSFFSLTCRVSVVIVSPVNAFIRFLQRNVAKPGIFGAVFKIRLKDISKTEAMVLQPVLPF